MSDLTRAEIIEIFENEIGIEIISTDAEKAVDYVIASLKTDAVVIPKGATNGEVLKKVLKGTFPEMICVWYRDSEHLNRSITFSEEWWNSPYKKGGK